MTAAPLENERQPLALHIGMRPDHYNEFVDRTGRYPSADRTATQTRDEIPPESGWNAWSEPVSESGNDPHTVHYTVDVTSYTEALHVIGLAQGCGRAILEPISDSLPRPVPVYAAVTDAGDYSASVHDITIDGDGDPAWTGTDPTDPRPAPDTDAVPTANSEPQGEPESEYGVGPEPIETSVKVYLLWNRDRGEWEVDPRSLDGYPLDGLDEPQTDVPYTELTDTDRAELTRAAHADLPDGATLHRMLATAIGPAARPGGAHYILIDRQHSHDLAIEYPTEQLATTALDESVFIDSLCEEDCLDAYLSDRAPAGYEIVIPPDENDNPGRRRISALEAEIARLNSLLPARTPGRHQPAVDERTMLGQKVAALLGARHADALADAVIHLGAATQWDSEAVEILAEPINRALDDAGLPSFTSTGPDGRNQAFYARLAETSQDGPHATGHGLSDLSAPAPGSPSAAPTVQGPTLTGPV